VSLPLTAVAALLAVLVFFLGFELFGLPLVMGDPEGSLVLSTYLYKLTNKLGTPSYHLMAAVAMCIVAITFPLVLLQRYLLQGARKYATIKGKAGRMKELPLGPWAWGAAALLAIFVFVTVIVPVSGIALRAFVTNWGFGVDLSEALTLDSFRFVFVEPTHTRAIWNTVLIGTVGGALTVACYTAIGFASHRRNDGWSRFLDYLVLVPRAVPGLLAGLAFLWVFLFFPPLTPLRTDDLQRLARLLGRVARLRDASHLLVSHAGEPRAGRSGALGGREPRRDLATHYATSHSRGSHGVVAARVHDLRARVLDGGVPAGTRHRGDRRAARLALAGWCHRHRRGALAHQHHPGRHAPPSRCVSA
jgi:iron(III) transport system permease protein